VQGAERGKWTWRCCILSFVGNAGGKFSRSRNGAAGLKGRFYRCANFIRKRANLGAIVGRE
jgi:hypothetical protein